MCFTHIITVHNRKQLSYKAVLIFIMMYSHSTENFEH